MELCHREMLAPESAADVAPNGGWKRVELVFEFAQLAFSYEQFDVYKDVSALLHAHYTASGNTKVPRRAHGKNTRCVTPGE